MRRPTPARAAAALGASVLLLTGAGCQQSAEEERADYCEQVKKDADELTRITDEGGAGGFLDALPLLEGLAEKSPSDLKDEWRTLLNALHGLEEAVEETDIDPDDLNGKLPADLTRAERTRVRQAATVLQEQQVVQSASGIEQHALDVCETPIL